MQELKANLQFPSSHDESFLLIKTKAIRRKIPLSLLKRYNTFSSNQLSNNTPQDRKTSIDEIHHQVTYCLSLIEDPLWKSICTEMTNMMGPSAVLKMWDSRLGSFSHQQKTMNLYCQTEEIAQFIQQYSFVILGSLQQYFPMMKDLKVKIKSEF